MRVVRQISDVKGPGTNIRPKNELRIKRIKKHE